MKEAELKPCDLCGKGLLHTGLPLFWRITIERFGVDIKAVQRQIGLSQFLGSGRLAAIMGPDEDMAKQIGDRVDVLVCEDCAMDPRALPIAAIADIVERGKAEDGKGGTGSDS